MDFRQTVLAVLFHNWTDHPVVYAALNRPLVLVQPSQNLFHHGCAGQGQVSGVVDNVFLVLDWGAEKIKEGFLVGLCGESIVVFPIEHENRDCHKRLHEAFWFWSHSWGRNTP